LSTATGRAAAATANSIVPFRFGRVAIAEDHPFRMMSSRFR
jgi:hypothetical protein